MSLTRPETVEDEPVDTADDTARLRLDYHPDVETLDPMDGGRCGVYSVFIDGIEVGAISLVAKTGCHAEIGYEIEPDFQGRGFATASVAAAIDSVRRDHGFSMLTARARADNVASIKVLEKTGFQRASAKLCCVEGSDIPVGVVTYRREI